MPAIQFLNSVNINGHEVQNLRVQNLATAPPSPVEGQIYWDTALDKLRLFNGTDWEDVSGGAEGTITSVAGAAPIESSGGTSPTISITAATTTDPGSMSAADKTKLDGVESGATADMTGAEILSALDPVDGSGSGLDADLLDGLNSAAFEQTANKGAANGYASLGGDSKIPQAQLPAVAISETSVVASEAEMVALTAQEGDIAVRTDESQSYILTTNDPTVAGNWQELLSPTDGVQSVTGAAPITSSGGTSPEIGLDPISNADVATDAAIALSKIDGAVGKYAETFGDGAATSYTITHSLGTEDVTVSVRQVSDGAAVFVDWAVSSTNAVVISPATAPASNSLRVVVTG